MTIGDLRNNEWWIVKKDHNEPIKIKVRQSDNFIYAPCSCKIFATEEKAKEFIKKRTIIRDIVNSTGSLYRLNLETLQDLHNELLVVIEKYY